MNDDVSDELRRLFEWAFGLRMIPTPDGQNMIRTLPRESEFGHVYEYGEHIEAEQVDLDDKSLIVISGINNDAEPIVQVKGNRVVVRAIGLAPLRFTLPRVVDTSRANVSFRNGVLDIALPYASTDTQSSDEVELRPE